jgi:dephospho-CoA kinase
MKPNIGLAGNMYAGKSTIADALTEHGYQRMSFAAPLKNVAALAYGTIDKTGEYDVMGRDGLPKQVTGRMILQGVGQAIKDVDRDFWIKCFLRDAERYDGSPLVVDDLRFMFEMEALRNAGWIIVGVNTPMNVRMERAERISGKRPSAEEMTHESEVEVPRILEVADFMVSGNGDPYAEAAAVLDSYKRSGR